VPLIAQRLRSRWADGAASAILGDGGAPARRRERARTAPTPRGEEGEATSARPSGGPQTIATGARGLSVRASGRGASGRRATTLPAGSSPANSLHSPPASPAARGRQLPRNARGRLHLPKTSTSTGARSTREPPAPARARGPLLRPRLARALQLVGEAARTCLLEASRAREGSSAQRPTDERGPAARPRPPPPPAPQDRACSIPHATPAPSYGHGLQDAAGRRCRSWQPTRDPRCPPAPTAWEITTGCPAPAGPSFAARAAGGPS